jgi:hypothetical protein
MKRLWKWLTDTMEPTTVPQCSSCAALAARLDTLEKAFAEEQKSNAELIGDLQEKLGTQQHRRSSGRPWPVLQKVAEMGAKAQR